MVNRTAMPHESNVRWTQQPPPYHETDHRGVPFTTSPHSHSENEPLLGYPITRHNSHPVQERPAANPLRSRISLAIVMFLLGASVCYAFDNLYDYGRSMRMKEDLIKWKKEKAAMDVERKKWHGEQRAWLTWDLHPGRCLRYATREYSATLSNIGIGLNGLDECKNKTLNIHGRDVFPGFCNLEGPCGRVTGHWIIGFDEVDCSPSWAELMNKGCDERTHKRHYESHLMNVKNRNDWEILCKTTPTVINGIPYDGAMSCHDSFWGVFGNWFVEDVNCL